MGSLQLFPAGCGGCRGSCCKRVPNGVPPWTQDELKRLGEILSHTQATIERAYDEKRGQRPLIAGACFRLSPDGLCGLEEQGLPKPAICAATVVGGSECLEERDAEGVVA